MNEESAVALLEKKRKKGAFQGLPAFDSTITLEAFPVTVSFSHYWTFPTRGLALRVLIFFFFSFSFSFCRPGPLSSTYPRQGNCRAFFQLYGAI